jgi:histidinol-phosphate aminotransferase
MTPLDQLVEPPLTPTQLAREAVSGMALYDPDVAACAIDLSDNTNLWGMPPAAARALREAPASAVSRYPSLYSTSLRDAILDYAGLKGVPDLGVVTGCGSDDVIDSTIRAFGAAGDRLAFSSPTFTMVPVFARLNGIEPVAIPFTAQFDVDADRLVEIGAKITYLCAPNNPTATAVTREAVEYVVANARGIVLLDEAYAEFAPEVFADLVTRSDRLLVLRTFSKAFGMAGLRVGYGLGHRALTGLVERARGPYKVSALGERAAAAALEDSPDGVQWMRTHAALAIEHRTRFAGVLRTVGLSPLPSAANFLFVPTARAVAIASALRRRGIFVRAFSGLPRDLACLAESGGSALRIGIGPWEMMQPVLDALAEAQS